MLLKNIALLSIVLALTGCNKIQSLSSNSVKCDDEQAKQLLVENISKQLSEASSARVKELIETENVTLDMGKLRAALKEIVFNVTDVRTSNSDPNSKKEYCVTHFNVNLPDHMVKDANASRQVMEENNVAQSAVLLDLNLENNKLSKELEYAVQPTDDGKKIYVELENADGLVSFVKDIAIDSLLKNARQNAAELAKQEEIQRVAQQNADAEAYQSVLISEAKNNLDKANENLNLIWNATTKDIRAQLLDEQRLWLKKRSLECKINSSDAENQEVARLNCETNMTVQRMNELRQKIYYLES